MTEEDAKELIIGQKIKKQTTSEIWKIIDIQKRGIVVRDSNNGLRFLTWKALDIWEICL